MASEAHRLVLSSSRRIAALTTGRQDWGILRSTCGLLAADSGFDLRLLAGGMHLSQKFGGTIADVVVDGFEPAERLAWADEDDASKQAGVALGAVARALRRQGPEALILVGDRFETAAAAIAATLERVPLVHFHGGEESAGAIDNAFRHAISQMSQLHFVSHEAHADRLRSMGIAPASIHVVGAPGLDNLWRQDTPDAAAVEARLGLGLKPPVVVVTVHPATAGHGSDDADVRAVCAAMDDVDATYVITLPNTDPGHTTVREALENAARREKRVAVEALGARFYWGVLRHAQALLGNSSSAIIEGGALGLPAVNVGERQEGRLRGGNVIDVKADAASVAQALRQALSPDFLASVRRAPAPFGDGHSGEKIVHVLRTWRPPFGPGVPKGAN